MIKETLLVFGELCLLGYNAYSPVKVSEHCGGTNRLHAGFLLVLLFGPEHKGYACMFPRKYG